MPSGNSYHKLHRDRRLQRRHTGIRR